MSAPRALVTGGASGIGFACAERLAELGHTVYLTSRRLDDAAEAARRIGPAAVPLAADLSHEAGVDSVIAEVSSESERLDVLVNNAGITWGAPLGSFPAHAFVKVLSLDVVAPFLLVQGLLPLLRAAGRPGAPARVVNLGSIDGHVVGGFDNFAYSAAKSGIHQLTRVLAYRLGPSRISVNCIAPGPTHSRMTAALFDEFGDELIERTPLGAVCEPADIAGALEYLVSPAARFVTGVVIPVDGGLSISPWWPAGPPHEEE